jgi:tRNA nucleotidyltransferase/poly(A) polymerase
MKTYVVGGFVRDKIMGVKSNDVDYTVVLDDMDMRPRGLTEEEGVDFNDPFDVMVFRLFRMGFKVFLQTPEHLTVRAQFPRNGNYSLVNNMDTAGLTADFVLARKESKYSDGRRPDSVEVGTLADDLARRDFSVNAIAMDTDGSYIDPFNGQADIAAGILRAVGDPADRLTEDALRAVRALRFAVTKGFRIENTLSFAMEYAAVLHSIETRISDDRISVELSKMFRFDTVASVQILNDFPALTAAMFAGTVSLDSSMKTKGRGK